MNIKEQFAFLTNNNTCKNYRNIKAVLRIIKLLFVLLLIFINTQIAFSRELSNKTVVIRYFEEVINKKNLELLNQVFADTFRVHVLNNNSEEVKSISEQKAFLEYLFNAFPDINYSIGDIVEEGDKLALRVTISATHKNEFLGNEPLGHKLNNLSEIFFFRIKDGKIVETWVQIDFYTLYNQLKG